MKHLKLYESYIKDLIFNNKKVGIIETDWATPEKKVIEILRYNNIDFDISEGVEMSIEIDKKYWGKRLSRKFINEFIDEQRDKGKKFIFIEASSWLNNSFNQDDLVSYYKRLNFKLLKWEGFDDFLIYFL